MSCSRAGIPAIPNIYRQPVEGHLKLRGPAHRRSFRTANGGLDGGSFEMHTFASRRFRGGRAPGGVGGQQQVRDAGYRERVVELRKAYPKGTPRLAVEKGTGVKPWSDPKELEEELVFAHDPARRWNCSTLDSYAVFMFADGPDRDAEPLVSIDLEQEDGDCFKLP